MLVSALFVSLLAFVPASEARGRPRPRPRPAAPNGGLKTKVTTKRASAKCIAVATTYNFSKSLDAHAAAVTEAWAYACDNPPSDPYYWTHVYEVMKAELEDHQGGFAFAEAIATAETYCRSKGNAWGCASAYAHAQAWAKASISAHADAWAQAIAECKCNDKKQTAFAEAENYASLAERITAKVSAVADSHTCVDGWAEGYDYNVQTCVQDIYAVAWAKSISKAVLSGVCFPSNYYTSEDYGSFFAAAEAESKVDITKTEVAGCLGYVNYYEPQYLANYRN